MAKICVDAGHGGSDSGAVGSGQKEKDNALRIALRLGARLKEYGHDVIMTRDKDVFVPLNTRADIANNTKCDFFISLHQNSAREATGLEAIVHTNASAVAANIAKEMVKQISEVTGLAIRRGDGIYRRNVTVVTRTKMPAVLLELGFINNAKDMQKVKQHEGEIVQRICNIVNQQYGQPAQEKEPEIIGFSARSIYRVYTVVDGKDVKNTSKVAFKMTELGGGEEKTYTAKQTKNDARKYYADLEPIVGKEYVVKTYVYDKRNRAHLQKAREVIRG